VTLQGRTILVAHQEYPQIGRNYGNQPQLPLREKELVLTFDDGPEPGITEKILAALANQMLQPSSFFVVIGPSRVAHSQSSQERPAT
jgi:peptidoglycan/xylan/chitin deacetylase (PgdA/CDA1 family)